jgi:hypothetical protein
VIGKGRGAVRMGARERIGGGLRRTDKCTSWTSEEYIRFCALIVGFAAR